MSSIYLSFDILKEFIPEYFKYCFLDEIYYWIIFIILFSISFVFAKKELYKINLILIYVISLLTVMFSLILCGKTCDMSWGRIENLTFFVSHINIMFLYKISLLIPLIMLVGYVSRISLTARKKICLFLTFIILVFGFYCLLNKNMHRYWQDRTAFLAIKQEELYKIEKMLRFYMLKNEQPEIYVISDQFFLFNSDVKCVDEPTTLMDYYSVLYKDNNIFEIGYCRSDNALEKFYEKGGTFSEKELEELKFERLKNDDFVLNKKAP